MATFSLRVNGRARAVTAEPAMPLLWVLRDLLGLTGTKFGCGVGLCGACTVHVAGKPARSCRIPVSAVGARDVVTVEGLAASAPAVQAAWISEAVSQCGYCQAGQLMTAAALLRTKAKPSDADIDAAFDDVLCRCGTYQRIRRAVHRAAEG
jgi:aerobic-type carbon monoxide dehydrogenase small subunit (CoxS/CutS family)